MSGQPDPYRTLGLEPGASMAEVKRAYRRLAKAFHPDSAGEAALPRFLAIHEAYEYLRTGRSASTVRPPAGAPAAEPWRADPARARAARERARTARSGGSRAPGTGGTPGSARTSGTSGPSGTPGASRAAGSSGSGRSAGFGSRGSGRRRETRKATLGSTSYDDARDATDATWSGASWYGPTTGEYWIVNPREYADPRKHGPDYQSRARRPADDSGEIEQPEPDGPSPASASASASAGSRAAPAYGSSTAHGSAAGAARASARASASDDARRWTRPAAWPNADQGFGAADGARMGAGSPGDASPAWRPPITTTARDWLGGPADDPIRRLGLALVAWPPIGLAAAATIGEITGCTVYSADCGGTDTLLPWLAQAGILGLLLLLPPFARLLAAGTVAVVLALAPVTAFLVVVGGAGQPQAGPVLAFLLGAVWLAGVGGSIVVSRRRAGPPSAGAVG